MKFDRVVIFAPSFEQRISKQAYSFVKRGVPVTVYAETAEVSKEFENYIRDVKYVEIPVDDKLKRTPLGSGRKKFIKTELSNAFSEGGKTLVVARDVNYGCIVGKILRSFDKELFRFVTDVADNYDLFYGSFGNFAKREFFKIGFGYLTRKAYLYSEAVYIVAGINHDRLLRAYPKELKGKKILLLRNLPMHIEYLRNPEKVPNSMVYVGKIDEISRDPFYVLEKLTEMPEFSLHFFSDQKKATIDKMKEYIAEHGLEDRVVFHQRVKYDELAKTISKYQIGLVPHKRGLITDYTLPNKMYDYKSSGIVTVMSDCPSLIEENREFQFGMVYSKEKDDFVESVHNALSYELDFSIHMPEWDEEFEKSFHELQML